MQLPEQTKEATSRTYSFILDRLNQEFPKLGFNQLLLPNSDVLINSTRLSDIILCMCSGSLFKYGRLYGVFIFQYRCDLQFYYHGVEHTVSIDYRKPEQYFTNELLSRFRTPHEHLYQELYWETGGCGMSGDPNYYTLCKTCLKKKPNFIVSLVSGLIDRLKRHFQGSV